jgi:exopolysaccharide biosynthesis protein
MLGCKDAINLDGGGSTTMYIKGQPFDGVVNYPCDNKQFDHYGERSVSNVVMILKK